jgi:hypothetical protein
MKNQWCRKYLPIISCFNPSPAAATLAGLLGSNITVFKKSRPFTLSTNDIANLFGVFPITWDNLNFSFNPWYSYKIKQNHINVSILHLTLK